MIYTWAIKRLCFPADENGGGGAGGSSSEGGKENGGAPANGAGNEGADPPPDNKGGQTEDKGKTESNPWDFDAEAEDEEGESENDGKGNEGKQDDKDGGEDVKIELPESLNVPTEYQSMLSEVAKETGLTSAQAQKFVEAALTRDRQMMQERLQGQDKALREEWGVDYEARCKTAVRFGREFAKMCGLTNEDMAAFKSPVGIRSLYRMSRRFAEGRMGGKASTPAMTPREQMQDMRSNPDNPYHRGLTNKNAPLSERRAAAEQYNRLAGVHIIPVPVA